MVFPGNLSYEMDVDPNAFCQDLGTWMGSKEKVKILIKKAGLFVLLRKENGMRGTKK